MCKACGTELAGKALDLLDEVLALAERCGADTAEAASRYAALRFDYMAHCAPRKDDENERDNLCGTK